jgi:adenylate cyclase class 2
MPLSYEVEQKFYADDLPRVEDALRALGAQMGHAVSQTDVYLSHPARDFAQTDEALRLRREGDANFITYKGPRVDQTTKTRLELELPLPDGDGVARRFRELLGVLGFGVVVEVSKRRRPGVVVWRDCTIQIALDVVERLGRFVELETIAHEDRLDAARRSLASLAEELGLTRDERRGYAQLMLQFSRNHERTRGS